MTSEQLTVFIHFTSRFDDIAREFPLKFRTAEDLADYDFTAEKQQYGDKIIRYFNLCSEEFFLHSNKCIPDNIWKIWKSQMTKTMQIGLFKRMWKENRSSYAEVKGHSGETFQDFFDNIVGE